ncbi:unnamed protein product [Blepharisma stoltei]|uniref:Transcription initiation factor IIB n=1 Tax=Blepharisma stoltei TaxID=1481888 RepID=A0AAU9J979_9CILI|nr:unnamed protein product [Blepharisma stoltei]
MSQGCPNELCMFQGLVVTRASEGTIVCTGCGLVLENRIIDETSEYRHFSKDVSGIGLNDQSRSGQANDRFYSDCGLGTVISETNPNGASLSAYNRRNLQSGHDKTLAKGSHSIDELCRNLMLNDTVGTEAKRIFKSIGEQRGLKGRPHMAIVSACVFIASRRSSPRSIREIAAITGVDKKDILRCYSMAKKIDPGMTANRTAVEYASRYSNELAFTPIQVRSARQIAERAIELGILTGKNPLSIASATVYIVGKLYGNDKTFSEISNVSTMKDITIKNCYKAMQQRKSELLKGLDLSLDPSKLLPLSSQ